jgi:hypothetical protein
VSLFTAVDPERFIYVEQRLPANGRGAWTTAGIGYLNRYTINPEGQPRIGTVAEKSIAHWSVAAGCDAIQRELVAGGYMAPVASSERGVFGPRTLAGVKAFQMRNADPLGGKPLVVDGIFGRGDARALFTPLIDTAEATHGVPDHLLRGEANHESMLDPGAMGYAVFYPDYRGIDRACFQINGKAHPEVTWGQAYDVGFAADWSAARLRANYDRFLAQFPGREALHYWRAAVLAHNNPAAATRFASTGIMPSQSAEDYVASVFNARY